MQLKVSESLRDNSHGFLVTLQCKRDHTSPQIQHCNLDELESKTFQELLGIYFLLISRKNIQPEASRPEVKNNIFVVSVRNFSQTLSRLISLDLVKVFKIVTLKILLNSYLCTSAPNTRKLGKHTLNPQQEMFQNFQRMFDHFVETRRHRFNSFDISDENFNSK